MKHDALWFQLLGGISTAISASSALLGPADGFENRNLLDLKYELEHLLRKTTRLARLHGVTEQALATEVEMHK